MVTDNAAVSALPDRLGRYAVRRRIGAGGFATVWLAYDEHLDSPVAVKVLADNWTEDHHVRTRFVEEGRYLRRVESPHVVTVYDAGELDDGRPYLVMTYADQGTLADRLEIGGLAVAEAAEVVRQVGAGLQALHDRDILHRDVKPANVLFRSVGDASGDPGVRAMVGDLGLGKALDMSSRLTMIAGSPSFVAPEQAQGETPGAARRPVLPGRAHLPAPGRPDAVAARRPDRCGRTPARRRRSRAGATTVPRRGRGRRPPWPSRRTRRTAGPTSRRTSTRSPRALGDWVPPAGRGLAPWLPVDPELTQPGARPVAAPRPGRARRPARRRGQRRRVAVAVRRHAARAGRRRGRRLVRLPGAGPTTSRSTDTGDELTVTVPDDWDGAVAERPVDARRRRGRAYPALSVGTSPDWTDTDGRRGRVPRASCPATELPEPAAAAPRVRRRRGAGRGHDRRRPVPDRRLHRVPRRRHRRAGGPGRRQPAAVGAGAQRRPGHGQRRPRLRRHQRAADAGRQPIGAAWLGRTWSSRARRPCSSCTRGRRRDISRRAASRSSSHANQRKKL